MLPQHLSYHPGDTMTTTIVCPRCHIRRPAHTVPVGGICTVCLRTEETSAYEAIIRHLAGLADDPAISGVVGCISPQQMADGLGLDWRMS